MPHTLHRLALAGARTRAMTSTVVLTHLLKDSLEAGLVSRLSAVF